MTKNLEEFIEDIKKQLGAECIDVIDRAKDEGQVAFATTEPDKGEDTPGKSNEIFREAMRKHGLEGCAFMPFPVSGRLIYVVSGLKRYA